MNLNNHYNVLPVCVSGRGLTLKILRRTEQCGGLEELKPVDQNLQYDFNYQQFTYLTQEVTVYPVNLLNYYRCACDINYSGLHGLSHCCRVIYCCWTATIPQLIMMVLYW